MGGMCHATPPLHDFEIVSYEDSDMLVHDHDYHFLMNVGCAILLMHGLMVMTSFFLVVVFTGTCLSNFLQFRGNVFLAIYPSNMGNEVKACSGMNVNVAL